MRGGQPSRRSCAVACPLAQLSPRIVHHPLSQPPCLTRVPARTSRSSCTRLSLDVPVDFNLSRDRGRKTQAEHIFDTFVRQFVGRFDNREQALADRLAGTPPREGGGHEHICCCLQPLDMRSESSEPSRRVTILATYHFVGAGPEPFRQRIYTLRPLSEQPGIGEAAIEMQIFRLTDFAEEQLLAHGGNASFLEWCEDRDLSLSLYIPGCDVFWFWNGDHFEGTMQEESAIVASPILNADIIVTDHLMLFADALWVNDRGWDSNGNYLYGNIRDIPYKMDRVDVTVSRDYSVWA
mmetsp:Transcript_26730/g.73198  ORF Transcript_26730/g.73198 Transcript_26730/m.73198 type:complete len:294 (-) Transcript_26730:51-932(-)